MKIAVVNLTGGGLSGGYVKYLRTLVPMLRAHREVQSLVTFSPAETRSVLGDVTGDDHFWDSREARRGFAKVREEIRRVAADVVFVPTARYLDFDGIPVAVMVRNMEPLTMPFATSNLLDSARNLARRHVARQACAKAQRVFAVSGFVREFITGKWGVPSSRIGLIYHGVDAPFERASLHVPPSLDVLGTRPFIFTAGSIRPARGLEDVIGAYARLARSMRSHKLVIAGQPTGSRAYHSSLRKRVAQLGVEGDIFWAGQLSPQQMAWCYLGCTAFVMSSRVEACPNTALEALAHGAVTISTRNPPMPEFFADSALYYKAGDEADLAAVLTAAMSYNTSQRLKLGTAGRARVAGFTWQRTADATVRELRTCIVSSESAVGDAADYASRAPVSAPGPHSQTQ